MKYPSDISTKQWNKIKHLFESERRGRHFQVHSKRKLLNAVLYVEKTGCQWRQLPHEFPKWQTVYSFFERASAKGTWEKLRAMLVKNPV